MASENLEARADRALTLDDLRDREAATREILQVVSRSRDDEGPVFDAILRAASRLCAAPLTFLSMANERRTHVTVPALLGARPEFAAILKGFNDPMEGSPLVVIRPIVEGRVIHVEDCADDDLYRAREPRRVQLVEVEGVRTILAAPLMSGEQAIGAIVLYRREVKPFSDDDIALVETFAEQAVIAIEKVRQFRELRSRLEREAATREILQVISRSRDDDGPVFETILRNAAKLCRAPLAGLNIANEAGTHLRLMAHWGPPLMSFAAGETVWPLDSDISLAVAAREKRAVQVEDLKDTDLYRQGDPIRVRAVDEEGIRTFLAVPLIGGPEAIGCIALYRREVEPFSAQDIALIETFAEQAVIAIENVRQFRALQERLAREAATGEVLGVISRSRDDERPVFETILENAQALCDAPISGLILAAPDDPLQRLAAHRGMSDETVAMFDEGRMPMDGEMSYAARCILEGRLIAFGDMAESDLYAAGSPVVRAMVDVVGIRSVLFVPLMRGDAAIGCVTLFRYAVQPFEDRAVDLVKTFAAQAVIAIENVRQFRALEASNEEVRAQSEELQRLNEGLESRVAAQVGEIERMGRLKRFLSPQVADAVVSSGDDKLLGSHRALISTLFCDIRGFTAFCETAEPEETIEVLQLYHEEMGKLIAGHGAGVDHRSGDGIMAIFNDPLPCDDPAGDALRMALAMRDRMTALCDEWRKLGHRLGFGVGISLGYATVGMVGSSGRYDYTASGTTVNLAARLCDEAGDGDILLSPRAYRAVEDRVEAEPFGALSLKGIQAPVEAVRVLGLRDQTGDGSA